MSTTRRDDPYEGYDVRLDGDPGSCQAAAAVLRAEAARLPGRGQTGRHPAYDLAERLAAALDRYGADLRRAQSRHAAAATDTERNAALALAARARRRVRLACADITGPGGIR